MLTRPHTGVKTEQHCQYIYSISVQIRGKNHEILVSVFCEEAHEARCNLTVGGSTVCPAAVATYVRRHFFGNRAALAHRFLCDQALHTLKRKL